MAKTSGAQPGNDNAAKGKKWKDALHYALTKDKDALNRVAKALIAKAEEGDVTAIKELGDRVDGRVTQPIGGPDEGPIHHRVEQVIVDPKS
jgi:hypothetical protein